MRRLLTWIFSSVLEEDVQQGSCVEQALECAVEEACVSGVVETTTNTEVGWPVGVNRSGVEGLGQSGGVPTCSLGLPVCGGERLLRLVRLRGTCKGRRNASMVMYSLLPPSPPSASVPRLLAGIFPPQPRAPPRTSLQ